MKTLLLAVLSCSLYAQTVISQTGPATVKPGGILTVNLQGQGGTDTGAAAFQWTVAMPSGYTATVQPGPAATAGNKTVQCTADAISVCLLYGVNATVIGNGVLATYTVHVPANATPGPATFTLSGLVGASSSGTAISTAAGTPYTVTVVDKRDLNGDGKVDAADVQLMTNQVLAGTCSDDQTGDGACNLMDVFAILLKALGLSQ